MAVKPSRLSCPLRKWRPPQTGLSMRRSNRVSSLGHVYFIRLVGERATGGRCLGLPVEHIWLLSRVRLKIIHWRLSPEPPELAGFYVDSVLFTKNLTGLPSVYCGALLRFEPCKHSAGPEFKVLIYLHFSHRYDIFRILQPGLSKEGWHKRQSTF